MKKYKIKKTRRMLRQEEWTLLVAEDKKTCQRWTLLGQRIKNLPKVDALGAEAGGALEQFDGFGGAPSPRLDPRER